MVNSVKLKIFSIWPKIQPKTTEIIFSPYFHFKHFPLLSHTHSSLTHALPLSKLHCSNPHIEPNGTIHTDAPRSRSCRSSELRRSTSITIAIAPIDVDRDHQNRQDCDCDLADLARSIDRDCDRRFAWSPSRSRDRDRRDCDRDLTDWDRTDRDRHRDLTEKIWSFLGFIWVFRNEWYYVFVW